MSFRALGDPVTVRLLYTRVVWQYTNLAAARSPGRDECVAEVLQADKRVVELATTAAHLVLNHGLGG